LQFLQIIILARLLVPADFGLMAVIGAVLAVVLLFSDLGLSRALIHYPTPSREVLSSLYWFNVGLSVGLMVGLMALAAVLASAYREPLLTPVLILASLTVPLSALGQQFRVLAEKDFLFAALARVEMIAALIGFAVAVLVASLGGGVFALISGLLATNLVSSFLAFQFLAREHRPTLHFRVAEAKPYLKFGGYLIGENVASTVRMQADIFIGGLIVGPGAMGVYALPRDLSLRIANSLVNPIVTRIGFPLMARLQDSRHSLKSVYMQTLRMTASVNFPIYLALATFSEEAVGLLLGSQWQHAGFYLRIFAVWGLIRSVGNPIGSLLYATGQVRLAFWWNIALLILVVPIIWASAHLGGLWGLAWGMLGTQVLIVWPAWRYLVYPSCGAQFREYMREIFPALMASITAGLLASFGTWFLSSDWSKLIFGVSLGGVAYVALSFLVNRPWINVMLEFFTLHESKLTNAGIGGSARGPDNG
jgi:O-antigen/teichoic acid export membrane protein